MDAVIIGAGLFGSIIARALRDDGHSVVVIDDARPLRASPAAACLMKPSWLSRLPTATVNVGFALLDELYGLETIKFQTRPKLVSVNVHWVNPRKVLDQPVVQQKAKMLVQRSNGWGVATEIDFFEATNVVIATGIWVPELIAGVQVKAKVGSAFLWRDAPKIQPFIQPYQPYKQIVGFNRDDGVWVGDGTSTETLTREGLRKSAERCSAAIGNPPLGAPEVITGARPYVVTDAPCYLEQRKPGLWIVTGGGKNGTLAAAWAASQIRAALK